MAGFQGSTGRVRSPPARSPRWAEVARTRPRWRWRRACSADACEIYTDVEGIFTADPRIVPDAQLIPVIGYEEMLELAHQGAQVMQTRAVELGWVNDVIIRVRSTFSDHPGTSIQEVSAMELRDKVRGHGPRPQGGQGHPRRRARTGPASRGPSSRPWPTRASTWT